MYFKKISHESTRGHCEDVHHHVGGSRDGGNLGVLPWEMGCYPAGKAMTLAPYPRTPCSHSNMNESPKASAQ